jgi:hypothetical protein
MHVNGQNQLKLHKDETKLPVELKRRKSNMYLFLNIQSRTNREVWPLVRFSVTMIYILHVCLGQTQF